MPYVFGVLTHTPPWVFLLFAYLVWQGIRALQPRTQSIWRLMIVPLIFIVWASPGSACGTTINGRCWHGWRLRP